MSITILPVMAIVGQNLNSGCSVFPWTLYLKLWKKCYTIFSVSVNVQTEFKILLVFLSLGSRKQLKAVEICFPAMYSLLCFETRWSFHLKNVKTNSVHLANSKKNLLRQYYIGFQMLFTNY